MSEDQPPDAENEADSTGPDAAAVRKAVTEMLTGAANPIAQTVSDDIHRIATAALGSNPEVIGIGNPLQNYTSPTSHLQLLDGGIGSSVHTAMEAVSRGASDWTNGGFSGLSPEIMGGHRNITDLITANTLSYTSPIAQLHQHQFDVGIGRSAQAAMDRLATYKSAIDERLHQYDFGVTHLAAVQSAMDALGSHQSTFERALHRHDLGMEHLPGVHSAMDALTSYRSAFNNVLHQYDFGVGQLTGAQAVIDASTSGWSSDVGRWAGGVLGGAHLTELFSGRDYGSSIDKLMRESQQAIQEFMRQRSLVPDPAAWMRDLAGPVESIADMMRSWWPAADRGLRAARVALRAALKVVQLLASNDPDAREAVQQFLIDWLGFRHRSHDLVCSATLVLLDVQSWLPTGARPLDFDPRPRLRKLTLAEHRAANRLSIDPELRFQKRPLLSLEQPVQVTDCDTTPISLRELLPDRAAPDPSAVIDPEISDPRIARLWWRFTDREREILRVKAQPKVTWAEAAVECGGTASEGEKLRRKVKNMAKKESAESSAPSAAEAG
ncbi:hypothetical protein ACGFK1_08725 [Mycobacterium sp. NPDC048908]|uniref:hypothetical protein n=1 Tax=Mycobacterium sp. NPDC048908 TaxID=3364292 RepID=UPI0037178AB8